MTDVSPHIPVNNGNLQEFFQYGFAPRVTVVDQFLVPITRQSGSV